MTLQIQVNSAFAESNSELTIGTEVLLFTPPIDDDYWLLRVELSPAQAVVAFPKFGTIGIGFQHEEDWNTNLPYSSEAQAIFNHIAHNKGDDSVPDEDCVAAIRLLQDFIKDMMNGN